MRIALGADHRGMHAISCVERVLRINGGKIVVRGNRDEHNEICDYPDHAFPVAKAVANGEADLGVLICGTGIGMCIAANKLSGVRAAQVHDEISAEMARRHNDANVICLSADLLGPRMIERLIEVCLTTEFEGGRHARRVAKITAIENGQDPRSLGQSPAATS